jgi:hypothetical protein
VGNSRNSIGVIMRTNSNMIPRGKKQEQKDIPNISNAVIEPSVIKDAVKPKSEPEQHEPKKEAEQQFKSLADMHKQEHENRKKRMLEYYHKNKEKILQKKKEKYHKQKEQPSKSVDNDTQTDIKLQE